MTKSTLIALYLTAFSVLLWIIFDIYKNHQTSSIPKEIENISKPIEGSIDTEMMELLIRRSQK